MGILSRIIRKYRYLRAEKSFGLEDLDLKLLKYLDSRGGFFVEAGGNDGISQSNTLFFEKYRNWSGLLIEPIPELATLCRKNRNRRRCIIENCALVPFDWPEKSIQMRYCNLMSLTKGAMKKDDEIQHIVNGCVNQNIETYEITVPAKTLTSILDQHRISTINFLSLDVEGFELQVLQGLDFERYKPRWMLVEVFQHNLQGVETLVAPLYEQVAQLSHHDILYKLRQV